MNTTNQINNLENPQISFKDKEAHETSVKKAENSNVIIFLRALKSEWIKIASLKSTWIILGLSIAYNILNASQITTISSLGSASLSDNHTLWHYANNSGSNNLMEFLCIFAIMTLAGEYNYGTIQITQLAVANRTLLFLAKTVFIALISLFTSCFMSLLNLLVAVAAYDPHDGGVFSAIPEQMRDMIGQKLTINPATAFNEAWQLELVTRPITITFVVLIALSCTFIVKNLIGSLFSFVGIYAFAPAIALLLYYVTGYYKTDRDMTIIRYLPSSLVGSAYGTGILNFFDNFSSKNNMPSLSTSIISLFIWAFAFLLIAYFSFIKSDSSSK